MAASLSGTVSTPSQAWKSALLENTRDQLFASSDLDETRNLVGRVMKPHALEITGSRQRLGARMHYVPFGEVSLSRLRYGACVDIIPDRLDDFFLIQMPITGGARILSGDEGIDSDCHLASVLSTSEPIRMRWSAESDQLMVRIPRARLEQAVSARLGRELLEPVRFALGMDLRYAPAWSCLVSYLVSCCESGVDVAAHPLLAAQVDQMTIATLLGCQPHNFSLARATPRQNVLPRHVRRVADYLQSHAHEPISIDQLAQHAGVSVRSLYAGFRQFCGASPMDYLRQVRLERARMDLLTAACPQTVASVALRWGFGHLGRFSAQYKKRFGESPVETLRRR